jgi:hypothetical protein
MTHSFELKKYKLTNTLNIIDHRPIGTPDWRTVHKFTDDELDELRRILGVGMGDCDHCPAWKPYMESTKVAAQKDAEVISHDMKRLCEHELWLKGHSISLEQLRDQQDINTAGITALGNKIGAYGKRIGTLETRMDNIDGWGTRMGKRLADVEEDHRVLSDEVGEMKRSQINTTAYREICQRLVCLENDERLESLESEQDILSQHMVEIDNLIDELKTQVDLMAFIEAYARGRRLLEQDRKDETNKSGIGSNKTT